MEQGIVLTEGKVSKTLLKFASLFLLASLLQALYGAADLLIVGKYADSAGVSAVATGSQIMQTITGVVLGLTTGGTILIGQYLGAKKEKKVLETIGNMICLFSVLGIVLTVIMLLLTKWIVVIMQVPVESLKFTKEYIFICSAGIPFIIGYNVVSGILRGLGDSKTPLYFILVACIVNIVVDLVLVGIFKMGAAGAAIATISAQAISLFLAIIYLKKNNDSIKLKKEYINFKSSKVKQIIKLGAPIALQDGLINISFLLITAIINSMGLIESASVGVVEKIIVFTMLVPTAFASAIAVMVAQNMGAKEVERAKKSLYVGIFYSLIFGIICCIYSQINPTSLTRLFSNDVQVIETAAIYLKSYSIDCIMVAFVFCLNSFFSGCGHSIFPMIHSLIATFLVRIPVSYFLSKVPGITLYEIGFASPLASLLSIIICLVYFKSGTWQKNNNL